MRSMLTLREIDTFKHFWNNIVEKNVVMDAYIYINVSVIFETEADTHKP